jgi:site-specific recombinase XerD/ferredoxin
VATNAGPPGPCQFPRCPGPRDGTGWDVEYPREIWRLHKLNGLKHSAARPQARIQLRFDRITQPWLKDLGKRWVRYRLTSGLSVATCEGDVQALTRFSQFLTAAAVDRLADVDRALLERYLAWLTNQPGGERAHEGQVGGLHTFLQAIRQHGWDPTLPTTAAFFTGDVPRRRQRITRHLAEHVMAQVEQPTNLDRWPHPEGRLVTMILMRCGLRVAAACTLPFDCLLHDGQGAPYLRYFNTKMEREAAVPIDEELENEIRAQQRRVLDRWPDGNPNLFPRQKRNVSGQRSFGPDSYRSMLNRWLESCDVRDEHGRPVHLTPHQWRHTFATRLINRDVPQEVIRVLLDHDSIQMTAHYAKITDQTVRRRWEAATKVNIKGERVALDPDGPLAQAQWAKTRYAMATQTLSNGYCGLPVRKSCPHANACLTCPVFLTGAEFLSELREQRRRTLTLIDVSRDKGQDRVVEMNQQVLTNLDRMIGEIEKDTDQHGGIRTSAG